MNDACFQLFTIGLWQLNLDGQRLLDDSGEPIPTYDNGDIMNFARIWTAVTRQPSRDNTEMRSGIGTANFIDPNDVDIQLSTSVKRDVFPKMDLYDGHIGDGYPICSELPPQSFLRSGAKYTLLGDSATPRLQKDPTSWEGSQDTPRLVLDPAASSLYRALCADPANGGACAFPRTVVLSSHLACNGRECAVNTARVVKLTSSTNVTQYYEYEPAPCVELTFYENARYTWEHYYRYCLDPASIGGGAMCCDHTSDDWQTSQHECDWPSASPMRPPRPGACPRAEPSIQPRCKRLRLFGHWTRWMDERSLHSAGRGRRGGWVGQRGSSALYERQKVARGLWQPLPVRWLNGTYPTPHSNCFTGNRSASSGDGLGVCRWAASAVAAAYARLRSTRRWSSATRA